MKIYNICLCLTYFTKHNTLQVHICYHKWQDFILFMTDIYIYQSYTHTQTHTHTYVCPFICQWTLRLFLYLGYCKQCFCEHWGVCVCWNQVFIREFLGQKLYPDMFPLLFQSKTGVWNARIITGRSTPCLPLRRSSLLKSSVLSCDWNPG